MKALQTWLNLRAPMAQTRSPVQRDPESKIGQMSASAEASSSDKRGIVRGTKANAKCAQLDLRGGRKCPEASHVVDHLPPGKVRLRRMIG